MNVRRSTDYDRTAIGAIHASSFGQEEGQEIVQLVNGLMVDPTAQPLLSLVADRDGRLLGHILFSAAKISTKHEIAARILAPLAVSSDCQGTGVGGALIREGLKRLSESGVHLVFVLGHPDYYPRFGFHPAGVLGFEAPYPIPSRHAAAWMVQELVPGIVGSIQGRIQCAQVLDQRRYWQE